MIKYSKKILDLYCLCVLHLFHNQTTKKDMKNSLMILLVASLSFSCAISHHVSEKHEKAEIESEFTFEHESKQLLIDGVYGERIPKLFATLYPQLLTHEQHSILMDEEHELYMTTWEEAKEQIGGGRFRLESDDQENLWAIAEK